MSCSCVCLSTCSAHKHVHHKTCLCLCASACVYVCISKPRCHKKKKKKSLIHPSRVCEMQRRRKRRRVDCSCKIKNPSKEVMPSLLCEQLFIILTNLYAHTSVDSSCRLEVNPVFTSMNHPALYTALCIISHHSSSSFCFLLINVAKNLIKDNLA